MGNDMSWTTPKADRTAQDEFVLSDYDRIRDNLLYLQQAARALYPPVEFEAMEQRRVADLVYLDFWHTPDANLTALLAAEQGIADGYLARIKAAQAALER